MTSRQARIETLPVLQPLCQTGIEWEKNVEAATERSETGENTWKQAAVI